MPLKIEKTQRPSHIAIIMDGNGRWAQKKGLPRTEGHKEGSNSITRLLDTAIELDLKFISLYAFSTENWKRPITEIQAIFNLLNNFIDNELDTLIKNNIRVHHSGTSKKIPLMSLKKIKHAIDLTKNNSGLVLNFCLNYGSQDEILNAFNTILSKRKEQKKPIDKPIKIDEFEKSLYTYPLPSVDLLIRTAGEQRLSNFLLWQSAYAELYFTNILWPDFDKKALMDALEWYDHRVRKFGGL